MNEQDAHAAGQPDGRPTLLIADDDAIVRLLLMEQLAHQFRIVATAQNATEAIERAEEQRPDVALIDVEMPHGGARAAVAQIAQRSPATRMVILSADESQSLVLELLSAGAVAYIRKGVSPQELSETLSAALAVGPGS
ncbi:MAG: response regulator transcription factor [Actinomycetota bacterium]|nr:response regulator transcription factor [Actinomycetota bacterium]